MTDNMGGNSTLQRDSSTAVTPQGRFDLKSWQGLTELLKVGKDSLSPEVYGEFRNLVLQYAQHGGDAEYKARIDAVIATFGQSRLQTNTAVSQDTPSIPVATNPLSSRRVQPRFDDISFIPKSIPVEKATDTPISVKATDAPTPAVELPIPPSPVIPVVEPEPVVEVSPVSLPTPEPVVAPVPEPVSEPIPAPTPVVELPVTPEPIREVPPPPVPVIPVPPPLRETPEPMSPPVFLTLEQCKIRIAEIKRAVNTHFGNPVALMAVPNGLGKIYMSALLTALKATGSGAPGGVDSAMVELERAYTALMEGDIVAPSVTTKEPTPAPAIEVPVTQEPTPVVEVPPPPIPEPVVAPAPEPVSEPIPAPTPVVELPVTPEPIREVPPPPVPEPVVVPPPPVIPVPAPMTVIEEVKKDIPVSAPEPTISKRDVSQMRILERIEAEQSLPPLGEHTEVSRTEVMHSAFEKTDDTISAVVGSVHKKLPPIAGSLAEIVADEVSGYDVWQNNNTHSEKSESDVSSDASHIFRENKHTKKGIVNTAHPDELEEQGISTSEIAVKQAELSSPQITTMLNKLLHDWNIFSGSGIFGMGPGGADHPLYRTLAPLSMGEVVAGRFDGADPKNIKILNQYIDAWRNEQGITYTINETFEHYLRRVVQRILKRQSI
jgi:hypothetical protein